MGYLTRLQIVTRGLQNAGASSNLETRANEWLNSWLRSQYEALPWPFLTKRQDAVSLATAATSVDFGAGNTITPWVRRILDPIWVYNTGYTVRQKARIRNLLDGAVSDDWVVNDPTLHTGIPTLFAVQPHPSTQGAVRLIPNTFPDRDLLLGIQYIEVPIDIDETTTGDSTKPVYPSDRTMVQAVKLDAMRYERIEGVGDEAALLTAYVQDDKLKYGATEGINQSWGLDPKRFRSYR